MLKTILSDLAKAGHIRLDENKLNIDGSCWVGDGVGGRSIKNLSNIEKLAKSKLLDFAKTKPSARDFLFLELKRPSSTYKSFYQSSNLLSFWYGTSY